MNRAAPRKSSLAGTSALTPPPVAAPQPEPAKTPEPASVPAVTAAAVAPTAPASRKTGTGRMAYYVDEDTSGRIRTAFLAGRTRYGWRSLTDFQLETVMKRVKELEGEFNGGQPFAPSAAGTVAVGRPIE